MPPLVCPLWRPDARSGRVSFGIWCPLAGSSIIYDDDVSIHIRDFVPVDNRRNLTRSINCGVTRYPSIEREWYASRLIVSRSGPRICRPVPARLRGPREDGERRDRRPTPAGNSARRESPRRAGRRGRGRRTGALRVRPRRSPPSPARKRRALETGDGRRNLRVVCPPPSTSGGRRTICRERTEIYTCPTVDHAPGPTRFIVPYAPNNRPSRWCTGLVASASVCAPRHGRT